MLTEPAIGTVVVSGKAKPLLENVSATMAYAVVCFVIVSLVVDRDLTTVWNPVDSCLIFACDGRQSRIWRRFVLHRSILPWHLSTSGRYRRRNKRHHVWWFARAHIQECPSCVRSLANGNLFEGSPSCIRSSGPAINATSCKAVQSTRRKTTTKVLNHVAFFVLAKCGESSKVHPARLGEVEHTTCPSHNHTTTKRKAAALTIS